MNTVATIMAVLGINTKPYSDGMRDAARETEKSTNKLTRTTDKLWESNNRVTNQAQGFARSLLHARSATDVLVAGLDRLENALNLPLGAGIALTVAAVVIDRIGTAVAKAKQLREEIGQIGRATNSPTAQFDSLSVIDARLDSITAKLKLVQEEHRAAVAALASSGPATQAGVDATNRQYGAEEAQLAGQLNERNWELRANKARQQIKVDRLRRTEGDDAANRRVAYNKHEEEFFAAKAVGDDAGMQVALERLTETINQLDATLQKAQIERTQMSLSELAAMPAETSWLNADGTSTSLSYEQWNAGNKAREVQAWEAQAENHRQNYRPADAAYASSMADQARNGIGNLKESEKDLKGQINASDLPPLLQTIAENTGSMFQGR